MTELSVKQKMSFYENGYIVLPGIVPIDTVNAVRRLVNRGLGHLRSKAQTAARNKIFLCVPRQEVDVIFNNTGLAPEL